jgi:hypothetical protein
VNRQFDWVQAQDMQLSSININSTLDDCIVEVHRKHSNPMQLKNILCRKPKNYFLLRSPWHVVITSGSEENDPKLLKWCLEHWKAFKKTLPSLEDETNNKPSNLNNLNKSS